MNGYDRQSAGGSAGDNGDNLTLHPIKILDKYNKESEDPRF